MPENLIYFNNTLFKEKRAPELAQDRGLFFGDGVFESMRSSQGRILGEEEHIQRLFHGMSVLQIENPWDQREIQQKTRHIIEESGLQNCYLRLTVTRGKWQGSIPPLASSKPNLIIVCRKFLPFNEALYERGFRTITLPIRRNETSPLCQIKSLNYLDNILGRMYALEKEVDDGLFLNTRGFLAEATASNAFLAQKERLVTPRPEDGILQGITRKIILEKAPSLGLKIETRSIKPDEIFSSDEAFLTNSLTGVVPWVESNGQKIGSGQPGPVTKKIRALYQSF